MVSQFDDPMIEHILDTVRHRALAAWHYSVHSGKSKGAEVEFPQDRVAVVGRVQSGTIGTVNGSATYIDFPVNQIVAVIVDSLHFPP